MRFAWSNKKFNLLEQDLRTIIGNILEGMPLRIDKDSWEGVGIFGRFGISDGRANPYHQFYSFGFGGKGMIPGRENDQWGIGYYYMKLSDHLPRPLRPRFGLDHDQGGELYYNFQSLLAYLTPHLQFLKQAKNNQNTAVVLGGRMKVDF